MCGRSSTRAVSLSLRFTRFRTTALPTLLLTEKPNRQCSASVRRAMSTSLLSAQLLPSRLTAAKSFVFLRRCCFCISAAVIPSGKPVAKISPPSPAFAGAGSSLPSSRRKELNRKGYLHGKLMASSEHAALQHIAAVLSAHARSEAMYSHPTTLLRLIGSLRHLQLLSNLLPVRIRHRRPSAFGLAVLKQIYESPITDYTYG